MTVDRIQDILMDEQFLLVTTIIKVSKLWRFRFSETVESKLFQKDDCLESQGRVHFRSWILSPSTIQRRADHSRNQLLAKDGCLDEIETSPRLETPWTKILRCSKVR